MTTAEVANKLKVGTRQVQRLCQTRTLDAAWGLVKHTRHGVNYYRQGWNISATSVAALLKTKKYPSRG